jgi:cytochrome c oxidase assembly protein subunit 15
MSFKNFAKFTLVSIFLIIVAGAVVRMTGSGMGCPDWPKCFGLIIPPTQVSQIQWEAFKPFSEGQMILIEEQLWSADNDFITGEIYNSENWTAFTLHDYHIFDPLHTWFEYINRLIGALSGLFTFILFLASFKFAKSKPKIILLSALVLFLMGFQGWLGATVVFTVLLPAKITIHMLMALLIVAVMVYLISEIPDTVNNHNTFDSRIYYLLSIALMLSLVQITLGSQVRQLIDEISKNLEYQHRELWIGITGAIFKVHRSFAIFLVLTNGLLFLRNFRSITSHPMINSIFIFVMIEVCSGIVLTYFDMMSLMQPIHLVSACLIFVLQTTLWFKLRKLRPTEAFH